MNIRKIHESFLTGYAPVTLIILLFVLFRFIGSEDGTNPELWFTAGIQIITAFSIVYTTQSFLIIRKRSLLPAILFLLFTGTEPILFSSWQTAIFTLVVFFAFFLFLFTYQNEESQGIVLSFSVVITLLSLWWLPALFLFPLFWYGLYQFRSLTVRTFFASLLGYLLTYLFIFTWSVFKEDISLFINLLPNLQFLEFNIYKFDLRNSISILFLILLFILASINIFFAGISEKIKTRTILSFLSAFSFCIFFLLFFQSQWEKEWTSILYLSLSILIGHYFTLAKGRFIPWLMLISVLFFLGIFVWHLFFPST